MSVEPEKPGQSQRARPRGRRRSKAIPGADARSTIVAAASHEFVAHGYDAASFRAIARRAGVDPALVHHYFAEKADLFAEAIGVPVRPDRIVSQVLSGPPEMVGQNLVRAVLTNLDDNRIRDRVIGLIRTALGHEFAAAMVRQFIVREVLSRISAEFGAKPDDLRATLVATQIVGLMMVRYGLRVEPLASAPIEAIASRIGPVIQELLLDAGPERTNGNSAIDGTLNSAQ